MIKLIWKYLKKYWYLAILAPLFMLLEVTMDMLLNKYMAKVIDFGISGSNLELVVKYGLIMLGIVAIGVVCGILAGVFTNLASFKATNDLRKDAFKKIMHLSYHQTDKFSTGSLVIRITNDITQIQNMISMSLRMTVRALSMFILGVVFTLSINKRFAIVLAVILVIELIAMFIFMKKSFPYFKIMQTKIDRVNTVVHENVSGARVVKAYGKEDYESNRFEAANKDQTDLMLKVHKILALLMPLLMLIVYVARNLVYGIGGASIIEGWESGVTGNMITVGEISQATAMMTMICMSVMMLGMQFAFIARASASASRLREVMDSEYEIVDGPLSSEEAMKDKFGTIEFKNVSFHYPDTEENVLDGLDIKINKGETIAVVGSTGSGKTTLINLITRFYDVTGGEVLVDGHNVKDYKLFDLREKIGICLQTSEMFAGTIGSNIQLGKLDATKEEILEAARISQALEFINSKPDGLDEKVEEKGTSLSGGQKQRVAIARAIIKKPEILIFDDSTSALDLVTEAKLYKEMKATISDTTKVVVAQRIATAKNADKIIVLDGGKIVGFDTHEKLMEECKVYKDIYSSQLGEGSVFDE